MPVLCPRSARHRHLSRLRPYHQLHRRDCGRVSRGKHVVLRHAQGTPRVAEAGRRETGLHRVQDRRPCCGCRALGIPGSRDRDDELTKARAALNWEKHFELSFDPDTARAYHDEDLDVDTDFCAMCGHDWCSVRISKEIQEFASGKTEDYQRQRAKVTEALTPEQLVILEKRGVLSPDELHRLAHKTRHAVTADSGKAACHSDYVNPDECSKFSNRACQPCLTRMTDSA